jgi:hypothetical protein
MLLLKKTARIRFKTKSAFKRPLSKCHLNHDVIYNAVAPKIVPFSTVALLQRGERVTITCTMAKGDVPLNILWLKDGIPLANTEDERVKILTFDHYNSMLTIESLELRHVGNYTCQAANAAGMASHSQAVLVNGNSLGTKSNWNAPF